MKNLFLTFLLLAGLAFSAEITGFQVSFFVEATVVRVPVSGNESEFIEITNLPNNLSSTSSIKVEMSNEDDGLQSIQNTIYEISLIREDGSISENVAFPSPIQIRLPFYGDSIEQVVLKYLDESETPSVWKKDGLSVTSINIDEDYIIASVMHFTKFSIFQYQDYQAPVIEWIKMDEQLCFDGALLSEKPVFTAMLKDQDQNDSGLTQYGIALWKDDYSFGDGITGNLANISSVELGLSVNAVLPLGNYDLSVAVADDVGNVTSINWQVIRTNALQVTNLLVGPNPVNINKSNLHFTYNLSQDIDVAIKLFDVAGRKVKELAMFSGSLGASSGPNHIEWDGYIDNGQKVPTGLYFVYLVVDDGQIKDISKFTIMVVK